LFLFFFAEEEEHASVQVETSGDELDYT
jgi:hypothetical protein